MSNRCLTIAFYASAFELDMQHANGVRYIRVTRYGEILLSARIFVQAPKL